MSTKLISLGIDAITGRPAAELSLAEMGEMMRLALPAARAEEAALRVRNAQTLGPPPSLGSADDLRTMGWGIVWPPDPSETDQQLHLAKLKQALRPLIQLREEQMGTPAFAFQYQAGWSVPDFLWGEGRQVTPYNMDTEIVPYYLLLVGSPAQIPWSFQTMLDAEYAVGRLWFDELSECRDYVSRLVRQEREQAAAVEREVLFVAPQQDEVTRWSAEQFASPLRDWVVKQRARLGFTTSTLGPNERDAATCADLLSRLRGPARPALLFTASHGGEWPSGWPHQQSYQGALVLQEWPGPGVPLRIEHLFNGASVEPDTDLTGTVVVCFACHGAGTPVQPDWLPASRHSAATRLADAPFVARLPQTLLARGAPAFIGHVSRGWATSFLHYDSVDLDEGLYLRDEYAKPQIASLREVLHGLLSGQRVGHALDYLNTRWVNLSAQLESLIAQNAPADRLAALWLTRLDGRGWVVLGDPAARIKIADGRG